MEEETLVKKKINKEKNNTVSFSADRFVINLPVELWKNVILSFLSTNDLLNLRLTIKFFNKIIINLYRWIALDIQQFNLLGKEPSITEQRHYYPEYWDKNKPHLANFAAINKSYNNNGFILQTKIGHPHSRLPSQKNKYNLIFKQSPLSSQQKSILQFVKANNLTALQNIPENVQNFTFTDRYGHTPLLWAYMMNNLEIAAYLEKLKVPLLIFHKSGIAQEKSTTNAEDIRIALLHFAEAGQLQAIRTILTIFEKALSTLNPALDINLLLQFAATSTTASPFTRIHLIEYLVKERHADPKYLIFVFPFKKPLILEIGLSQITDQEKLTIIQKFVALGADIKATYNHMNLADAVNQHNNPLTLQYLSLQEINPTVKNTIHPQFKTKFSFINTFKKFCASKFSFHLNKTEENNTDTSSETSEEDNTFDQEIDLNVWIETKTSSQDNNFSTHANLFRHRRNSSDDDTSPGTEKIPSLNDTQYTS